MVNGKYFYLRQEVFRTRRPDDYDCHGICRLPVKARLRLPSRILRRLCDHLQDQGKK